MNTIPTIFNEELVSYTAVGGKERTSAAGISCIVLNPPGPIRRAFLQELEKTGFDNVVSIESASSHYEIEEMSGRFPFVRFIIPEKELNIGQKINLAAKEIESPLFFVIRSDMKIIAGGTARRMAERLVNKQNGFKRLCTVPVIVNQNYEVLPSIAVPVTQKKKIKTALIEPHSEDDLSLYPFDGLGIYDRSRFIQMGGFDPAINKLYWQLMDFGFRAFLWGEEITVNLHLKLVYEGDIPMQDYTVDEYYRRFYLKNLAPVFKNYAHLPFYCFPNYLKNSGQLFFEAWNDFKQARKWVKINKFRWKRGAVNVTDLWDKNIGSSD